MKKINKTVLLILHLWLGMLIFCIGCGSNEEVLYMEASEESTQMRDADLPTEQQITDATAEEDNTVVPQLPMILVHVCGAVRVPGVYELAEDSRVIDAVTAAGGLTENADSEYVNLAASLSDGDKVRIPTVEEVQLVLDSGEQINATDIIISPDGQTTSSESEQHKININTADIEELCTLPGIGETRAESILAYRQEKGAFSTIEDIMQVSGIKENSFQKIKDRITVK